MEHPALNRLIDVIKALRHPETGCPWDLKQTHQSLLRYLFEESYEFTSAVESENDSAIQDELGDLLLQVLLHAQIAQDEQRFSLDDVADSLAQKLIRRHPHVFDKKEGEALSPEEVQERWAEIKKTESSKEEEAIGPRYLHHPALRSSYLIGKRTADLNFDWEDPAQVVYKVEEEWQELKEELGPGQNFNKDRVAEELGDFLFSAAQLARHTGHDPEDLLRKANQKFLGRFSQVESLIKEEGKSFEDFNQAQLDHYWNQVKRSR